MDDGSDGFFYCQRCGAQADGIRDTAVDQDEMLLTKENIGSVVQRRVSVVKPEPITQSQPLSQFWETLMTEVDNDAEAGDGVGPTKPADFGSEPEGPKPLGYEDYYSEIRMRYVMGVQIMIELQVKALVEEFNVCPVIVGMIEPVWLRFVASTKLFSDDWADEAINESESQVQGVTESVGVRAEHKSEPHNLLGKRSWEMSLSCAVKRKDGKKSEVNNDDELSQPSSSQSDVDDSAAEPYSKRSEQSNFDATEILVLLHSKYNELFDTSDHGKDLKEYLKYCKDVVFAGVELSFEDQEEDKIIEDLWKCYENKKDHKPSELCSLSPTSVHKRPRDHSQSQKNKTKTKKPKDEITPDSKDSHKDREISRMKSNMEENKFCYIPPRKRVKRHDYLHYTRKKGDGAYVYAAHADYYILLRSCARVAQLDIRSMHAAVLSFERRLVWLEKNIQHSLKQMPCNEDCQLCHDGNAINLSKLNL
ncbi:putative RNA polymerase I transcription initiation factor TAF1B/Rrn7 [Helianthus annuus]|nr:putative RNA polymerase I transcription initiation factor TAF1B/Rrn7 [Helianthus annuus]